MSINCWRVVEYTSDGCFIYQCLECYSSWEARTSPETWAACPRCGAEWDGQHECRQRGDPKVEPLRHTWEERARCRAAKRYWSIERRRVSLLGTGEVVSEWHHKEKLPKNLRPEEVLVIFQRHQARVERVVEDTDSRIRYDLRIRIRSQEEIESGYSFK